MLLPELSILRKLFCKASLRKIYDANDLQALSFACETEQKYFSELLEFAKYVPCKGLAEYSYCKSSQAVYEHFCYLESEKKEFFYVLHLDVKCSIVKKELISIGSLNISIVHPREVFASAIRECACHILLVHNHPSGDPSPSQEDFNLTQRLCQVGLLVGIDVLDHIVIGNGSYVSFAERRLM